VLPAEAPRFSKFEGTTFLSDFNNEQNRLRQNFITFEIEKQFGPQGITSTTVSSTTNRTPTAAEISAIEHSFRTPLQQFGTTGKINLPPNPVSASGDRLGPRINQSPTIISGRGVQRRRQRSGRRAGPTILTSDAGDSAVGGRTILG